MNRNLEQLRELLRQAVKACGLSARQIERQVGLGNGCLERILDGRNDLRVRHILGFAELLKVPPQDFLELGVAQPEGGTKYRLRDWLAPRRFEPASSSKSANGGSEDLAKLVHDAVQKAVAGNVVAGSAELKEAVRAVVREEMDSTRKAKG